MAVGYTPDALLGLEITQRSEEGCDVGGFEERLAGIAGRDPSERERLMDGLWGELSGLRGREGPGICAEASTERSTWRARTGLARRTCDVGKKVVERFS